MGTPVRRAGLWRDTTSDGKATFVHEKASVREGVIQQRGWDEGTVSPPRSLFTLLRMGRTANTQNNQGWVALQRQLLCPCGAMGKGSSWWEWGRMEATLGATQSSPCILQAPLSTGPFPDPLQKESHLSPFPLGPPRAPSPPRHHQGHDMALPPQPESLTTAASGWLPNI